MRFRLVVCYRINLKVRFRDANARIDCSKREKSAKAVQERS